MSVVTFFGPIVPAACNCYNITGPGGSVPESGAAWGCVLQVLQNLMNFGVSIGAFIIVIFIAWAGVAYLMSPINAEGRQKAKERLLNAVLGLFIMLAAWLFIDSIMKVIYNSNAYGPWNAILADNNAADNCIAPTQATPLPNPTSPANASGGTPPAAATTTPSGTCGANTHLNCPAAVAYLQSNVQTTQDQSDCLHVIRQALSAGGVSLSCGAPPGHSEWAGYCNSSLQALGFTALGSSDPNPQPADILVIQHSTGSMIGHITMWTGSAWVSDFIQSNGESPPGNPYGSSGYNPQYWRP